MSQNQIIEHIPMSQILQPKHAMRSDAWSEDIESLAASIKKLGLLQPVTVRPVGDKYEIIAGHRRYLAHILLERSVIPAIVQSTDERTSEAMKVHENLYRADINPVDQAIFIAEYMQRENLSVAEVAEQLNRSESWIKTRLDILTFPEYLTEYVHSGQLSVAAALILNRIENDLIKRKYCRDAATIGLSAERAKYWLSTANSSRTMSNTSEIPVPDESGRPTEEKKLMFRCELDGLEYPAEDMIMVYVLPSNLDQYKLALSNALESESATPEGEDPNAE